MYQDEDSEALTGEQAYKHLLRTLCFPPVTLLPAQVAFAAAAHPDPQSTRPLALSNDIAGASCLTQTRLVDQTAAETTSDERVSGHTTTPSVGGSMLGWKTTSQSPFD